MIKFQVPSVAPISEDEEATYSELETLINSGTYPQLYLLRNFSLFSRRHVHNNWLGHPAREVHGFSSGQRRSYGHEGHSEGSGNWAKLPELGSSTFLFEES